MQLALRPYISAAGVAVVGASLIHVTPSAAPRINQRAIDLAAAETLIAGPVDAAVSGLGGASGSLWNWVTEALSADGEALGGDVSGALSSMGDVSGPLANGLSSVVGADSVDFWQTLWQQFYDAVIPIVGPIELVGSIFLGGAILYADWFVQTIYDEIVSAFGGSAPAISEAMDPNALTAAATEALDPSSWTSTLDLNPVADVGAAVDPAEIADIGMLLSTNTIPDLGGLLTSLIP